jgi:dihydropteroate synthase
MPRKPKPFTDINHSMVWRVGEREIDLAERGLIMGILNITPDSFSDGGQWMDPEKAAAHAFEMEAEGASIIDIGGESTRPGAAAVSTENELARVIPVIQAIRAQSEVLISVDTSKAAVARAALDAGAEIINDVTGLQGDPAMLETARQCDAGLVVMHMKGDPRTMQKAPTYGNVVEDVAGFFAERQARTTAAGILAERILFDPGIGFGKELEHNLALLRHLDRLSPEERPLLIGVSRKAFIGRVLGSTDLEDRYWATVALTSYTRERGARVFRVHDVLPNAQALRMTEAILLAPGDRPAG